MSDTVTMNEAADILGRTTRCLRNWQKAGCPGFVKNGDVLEVSISKVKAWVKSTGRKLNKTASARARVTGTMVLSKDDQEAISITEARRRKELALARKHEWDLQVKKGQYIHRDELLDLMNRIGNTLKSKIIAQPSRLCARFADIDDARELQKEWDAEQWSLLNSISDEFGVKV